MTFRPASRHRRRAGQLCLAFGVLALAACAARPRLAAAPPPAPGWTRIEPTCKLDGCCRGHGEVAFVQPDRFIMCTDGSTSEICDCH